MENEQAQANNDVNGDGNGVGTNIEVVLKQTALRGSDALQLIAVAYIDDVEHRVYAPAAEGNAVDQLSKGSCRLVRRLPNTQS